MIIVERISHIKPWLESFQAGQVRVGFLTSDHFGTLNTKSSVVNGAWRDDKSNRWSHYVTNEIGCRVCVVCITKEERELELKDITHANDWKKKIPKFFFSKDIWEVGSKHD